MRNEIIQHHKPFDFNSFYETVRNDYVGIDYMDFENFMLTEGEKHSFIATSGGHDRIYNALDMLIASGKDIINEADSVMLTIVRSPESEIPIRVEEIQHLHDFISELPDDCDVLWGMAGDPSLGNEIRVILLVNLKG